MSVISLSDPTSSLLEFYGCPYPEIARCAAGRSAIPRSIGVAPAMGPDRGCIQTAPKNWQRACSLMASSLPELRRASR